MKFKENCYHCKHVTARDFCYFCELNEQEVEHPILMGGPKKCECFESIVPDQKTKFEYPRKKNV